MPFFLQRFPLFLTERVIKCLLHIKTRSCGLRCHDFSLFSDTFSRLMFVTLNAKRSVKKEMERMWKEAILYYFQKLFDRLLVVTEESQEEQVRIVFSRCEGNKAK